MRAGRRPIWHGAALPPEPALEVLTCLVGGDVHGGELRREGALVGDAVHGLDLEGVLGVGQQVADVDAGLRQAQLARRVLHVVPAAGAGAAARAAALTDDVVDEILAAPRVAGRGPLQHERGLVDTGDHGLGCRGDGWGGGGVPISGGCGAVSALVPAHASPKASRTYFLLSTHQRDVSRR